MKIPTGRLVVMATVFGVGAIRFGAMGMAAEAGLSVVAAAPNAPSAVRVLKSGPFVAAEHPTVGMARLVVEGNRHFVEFDKAFRTDSGPDLQVLLHKAPNVLATTTPPSYPLREGDYVNLGALHKITGAQRYPVPANIRLERYPSVAIWCRRFNATFGSASLKKPS